MKDSNKLLIGLGLGLIAAGSASYFLGTDEGKKFKKKTRKQLKALEQELSVTVSENAGVLSQKLSEISDKAIAMKNNLIETAETKISNTADIAEDKIDEVEDSFENGAEYARNRISEKAEKIDSMIDA